MTAKPCFRLPSDNLPPARLRTDMRRPATVMSMAKTGTWEPCGHVDAQEEHMTFMLEKSHSSKIKQNNKTTTKQTKLQTKINNCLLSSMVWIQLFFLQSPHCQCSALTSSLQRPISVLTFCQLFLVRLYFRRTRRIAQVAVPVGGLLHPYFW